jgi:hypothetical protein
MKATLTHITIFSVFALFLGSCNDDFLETEYKDSYILTDTLKLTGHVEDFTIQLGIQEAGNSAYNVMMYPKWIGFEEMDGRFTNGVVQFAIHTANEDQYTAQDYTGSIVLDIRDFGYIEIVTQYLNP